MSAVSYIDTHPMRGAFVANQLDRLASLINVQGEELLQNAGLTVPPRAVSSVLLIGERGHVSVADIARVLKQPHQLVTQRIELLIRLGIIERLDDPGDARRKVLNLTAFGVAQYQRLQIRLDEVAVAFAALFVEIECDLPAVTLRALDALDRFSILDRIQSIQLASDKH